MEKIHKQHLPVKEMKRGRSENKNIAEAAKMEAPIARSQGSFIELKEKSKINK